MMIKKTDWQLLLINYLTQNKSTPFTWGEFDCCLFACNCVEVMTGFDPGQTYRGRYTTAIGAQRALTKYAQGTIVSAFTAVFGPVKPRLNAGRGDIVLVQQLDEQLIGVMCGGHIWVVGDNGVFQVPFSQVIGCWHAEDMVVSHV